MPVSIRDETAIDAERWGENLASPEPGVEGIQRSIIEQQGIPVEGAILIFVHNPVHGTGVATCFDPRGDGERKGIQRGIVRNADEGVRTVETQRGAGISEGARAPKHTYQQRQSAAKQPEYGLIIHKTSV